MPGPLWLLIVLPAWLLSLIELNLGQPIALFWADTAATVVVAAVAEVMRRTSGRPAVSLGLSAIALAALGGVFWVAASIDEASWGIGSAWSAAVLAGVLAARMPPMVAVVGASAMVLACVSSPLARGMAEGLPELSFLSTLSAAAVGAGLLVRSQDRTRLAEQAAARAAERQAMAAELHDVIAHELTGMVVLAQALRPAASQAGFLDPIERIERAGQRALAHIRSLVASAQPAASPRRATTARRASAAHPAGSGSPQSSTAPSPIDPARVVTPADLEALVSEFRQAGPAQVNWRCTEPPDCEPLASVTTLALHRILREALTNIRRHAASAQVVSIALERQAVGVLLQVTDDGRGGGLGSGGGTGLAGIRERVELLHGDCTFGRDPAGRWVVRVWLPNNQPNADLNSAEVRTCFGWSWPTTKRWCATGSR